MTNIKLAKLIINIIKKKLDSSIIKPKIIFVKDRPGHDMRYALNSEKIKKKLKWTAKNNLKIGLKKTINWYLKNIDYFKALNKKDHINRIGLKV